MTTTILALASLAAPFLLGVLAATGHTADSRDGRDWHPHTPADTGRGRNDDDGGGGEGARANGNEGVARVLHYRAAAGSAASARHSAEESSRRAA
ncbi:hypothetical protein GCM10023205_31130 [Yinghuangia aomiensis]|uniref:Secreted protein n=1 Tax=Yinghuangia aomiensis TaxID=676205 RepID=A0ABP9H9F9_9ACTN